ncbi:MAG TPA: hypothetical protein P5056_02775 [Candidatus Paceibacterota bacterium]|nr:hypothetical protein [Candidatus Paceibacterota bacterium]
MFGIYSHLSDRLVIEIIGPTKNNHDLVRAILKHHRDLMTLNREVGDYLDREEEICETDWFFADEEFLQRRQDKMNLEVGWPIVEEDVPKMNEKARKRGLGKKGRLLAERRYRANGRKGDNSETDHFSHGRFLDKMARIVSTNDLDASFSEKKQEKQEALRGTNPWRIEYVPPMAEESLVLDDSDKARFFLKNGLQFAEINSPDDDVDDHDEWRPQCEDDAVPFMSPGDYLDQNSKFAFEF